MCFGCCTCNEKSEDDPEFQELGTKELDKGPIHNRKCRDVLWLLLFIVFIIGMLAIAGKSFEDGEPKRLIYGVDSWGNLCGQTNNAEINSTNAGLDLSDRPFLYYWNPTESDTVDAVRICVAACPFDTLGSDIESCSGATTECTEAAVCLTAPYSTTTQNADSCPDEVYKSTDKFNLKRCVPEQQLTSLVTGWYDRFNDIEEFEKVFEDFGNAWQRILYLALIAFGLSIVIVVLMRCFAGLMIYSLVLSGTIAFIALAVYMTVIWKEVEDEHDKDVAAGTAVAGESDNVKFFKGLAITCIVLAIIVLIIVIAMRKRIYLTVSIFKEASSCVGSMPQIYLLPLLTYVFLFGYFAYWIAVFVFLATSGTYDEEPTTGHASYSQDQDYSKMWWYHLFGLLWISQFLLACEEITLAGAVASWYWCRQPKKVNSPVTKSLWRVIRYHLGSVALGSLIIALIDLARIILYRIQKQLDGKGGAIADFFLKCLACCLWCFKKCMRFINKNAYIMIAIYGYSFCSGAREAVNLLANNFLRVAAINSVGLFVLFLCKLIVVGVTACIAIAWLRDDEQLHYYAVIVLVVIVFSYFIADTFIGVYKMAIDTIFLSFAEDSKRNNGKDKPYFMSDRLLKYAKGDNNGKEPSS